MATPTIDLFRNTKDSTSFPAGQTIFQEGQAGDVMYVVVEGEVDILVHGTLLDSVGPGGLLGEMALIENKPRSATAVAKTDSKLVAVSEKRFTFLVQQTPHFALQVMRVMADRLRRMDMRV